MLPESTGLAELDELLGGGVSPGCFVLVKGAPGTGKTTLCAQILANALSQGKTCIYVSVEANPLTALSHTRRCFSRLSVAQRQKLRCIGFRNFLPESSHQGGGQPEEAVPMPPDEAFPVERLHPITVPAENVVSLSEMLLDFWRQALRIDQLMEATTREELGSAISIVVLDSLTALVDAIESHCPSISERQILLSLINALTSPQFRTWLDKGRSTVYLITERGARAPVYYDAESYLADAIVELSIESIKTQPESRLTEPLLFCQATKVRGQPNQRRRCCYDFSPEGISFFPTYAAEGRVILYSENEPQLKAIEQLSESDIPALYPLVEVEQFSRPGLQTAFSVRRRVSDIPVRKPMVLTNVDEYWIKVLREPPASQRQLLEPIDRRELALYLSTKGEYEIIPELVKKRLFQGEEDKLVAVPHWVNVGMLAYRSDLVEAANKREPTTWEELEDICRALQRRNKHRFLIETTTYDSFMTTMLELMWNHGAIFQVQERKLKWLVGNEERAVAAMVRLNNWVKEGFVSSNSTVDPELHPEDDWVFARHWYSTLVHFLFTSDKATRQVRPRALRSIDSTKIRICRLPVSREYQAEGVNCVPEIEVAAPGHSAWGEWYLAIQGGTENRKLALDIINNLMSSRKVVERALSGAGLPPVEKFYELYGETTCPGTGLSFSEVRKTFFPSCLSRTLIDDYPRAARILYGPCSAIVGRIMPPQEIGDLIHASFREIQSALV